jgi:hypothetical protein
LFVNSLSKVQKDINIILSNLSKTQQKETLKNEIEIITKTIKYFYSSIEKEVKNSLKHKVDNLYNQINYFYTHNQQKYIPSLYFNDFFIYDQKGNILALNPLEKYSLKNNLNEIKFLNKKNFLKKDLAFTNFSTPIHQK